MAMDLIARLRLIDNMTAPMRKVAGGLGSFAGKIAGVGGAIAGLSAAMGATKLATSAFGKALDFEAQMSSIKALTGATTAQMAQMDELALTMGSKTSFSALQAASGIEELLKAGISPATVQSGALEAALNLATAGGLGLADAAAIMSNALNAFESDGMTAAQAADILAGTASASATGVLDLKQALSSVATVASGFGMTFKDTNAALGLFANKGTEGSDAGTSLKTMLQNLNPAVGAQTTLFKRLGIVTKDGANQFFTAGGELKSLDKIAGVFQKSLGKMTKQQRQQTLEAMLGADAVRAGNILYDKGADGVKKFYDEMSHTTALQVATERMNNGRGAIEQFKGALETLQIKAVKPLLPAIKTAFNGMGDYVNAKTPQIEAAVKNMTEGVSSYIKKHFTENKDFAKLPDDMSKFEFVMADFQKTFDTWYESGGNTQISGAVSSLVGFAGDALSASAPKLAAIGVDMGKSIGGGMLEGMKNFAATNPLLAALTTYIITPGPPQVKAAAALTAAAVGVVEGNELKQQERINNQYDYIQKLNAQPADVPLYGGGELLDPSSANITGGGESINERLSSARDTANRWVDGIVNNVFGHAGGLNRVPYNGYSARLHKDEKVLTKNEADSYREGGGKSGGSISITGNTFHVRQQSDISAIAMELAGLIGIARGARSIG